MFHQYTDSLDCPPQLEAFYELGNPVAPFLIGTAAAGTAVNSWLQNKDWSIGQYNAMMRKINDTIAEWDRQGGGANWNSCWGKYPSKRRQWKAFWSRWAKHYGEYGIIGECFDFSRKYTCFVPDSAEKPVREQFLPELRAWGAWLNKICRVETDIGPLEPVAPPPDPNNPVSDIASIVKWGVIGVGLVFALNVYQGTRGRRY